MRGRYRYIAFMLMFLLGIGCSALAVTVRGNERAGAVSTGLKDQTGVAVTIYNVNLGLVKDQREIRLPQGTGELRFMGVASKIIPTSVSIRSLIDTKSLQEKEKGPLFLYYCVVEESASNG